MGKPQLQKPNSTSSMTDLFGQNDAAPAPPRGGPIETRHPALRPDGQHACAVCGGPAWFGFA